MIDTIVIYINNLSKYPTIYEKFYAPSKKKNTVTTAMVDVDTGEIVENTKIASLVYHDTGRVMPLAHRSNLHLPSSHYSLAYFLNHSRDRLEFNFSIPKYLYGTNILQFINIFDQGSYYTYSELKLFLNRFFKEQFIQEPLYDDIEINRIDLCYNQFFLSKNDSLQYLDEQKKLLVQFARSSKNKFRTYDTSLMYITRRYSFKIYHKGEEFKKHDYAEIVRLGNPKNYDLMQLQNESDRILRYEMTFRKSFMNYLLQYYFFSSKTQADNLAYQHHPVSRFYAKLQRYTKDYSFSKNKKTIAEEFTKRDKLFTLKSLFDRTTDIALLKDAMAVTFDDVLFKMLFDTFWNKVKQYQLTTAVSYDNIMGKIQEWNKENATKNRLRAEKRNGLSPARLLVPALLSQYMPLDQLKQYLPKSTYFSLKTDLKKIGFGTNTTNLLLPTPALDYADYKIFFREYIHNHY